MEYKSNHNVVYSCKYHVVWCPKYRHSVLINGVDVRLKELIKETCDLLNVEIIEMEIMPDHVHLLMEVDPQFGVHKAVKQIKGYSSKVLRTEFPWLKSRLPSLWTNSYFVSTVGGAPLAVIKQYIENQKRSVKFYGNGRKNKYMRRHYKYLRKKLGKAKKTDAIKRINNKEQRIMKDIDHKLSREIVNTATAHGVSVIKMEQLANIRSTTRTSRKNNHSLHTWSFYRLAQFIEYKAKLAGIKVEYVNPAYTSQKCPVCGNVHHANDRKYICKCGFHTHRDILGAMNIRNSTEYVGDSNIRHTA
jgi:IS605 OrfB family transposase